MSAEPLLHSRHQRSLNQPCQPFPGELLGCEGAQRTPLITHGGPGDQRADGCHRGQQMTARGARGTERKGGCVNLEAVPAGALP